MRGCLAAERGGDGGTDDGAGLQRGLLVDQQVRVGGGGPSPSLVLQPGGGGLQRVFVQGPDSAVDNEPTVADVEVVELEAVDRTGPGVPGPDRRCGRRRPGGRQCHRRRRHRGALARLRTRGAELVGEVQQFEGSCLLCYVRGPEGILVGLAEQLS